MRGFSSQIESSIKTVIEGLNYDIGIDYSIKDDSEYAEYLDYNISLKTKSGSKVKGKVHKVTAKEVSISYFVKEDKERKQIIKTLLKVDIKEARVYEEESDLLEADKMKAIIDSKVSSFKLAKSMLMKWASSPNAPSKDKLRYYIQEITVSGDKALEFLKDALEHDIDYDEIEKHKIASAIKAKPIILNAVFELDASLVELKDKLENDDLSLEDREFKIGYPERFAKGEFYPLTDYFKDWYEEEGDRVNICPFSTKGEGIEITDLKIRLPKPPKEKEKILFSDKTKKEQYWRRTEMPEGVNPDNEELWDEYIKEEFRRRREGIWFMNNGEPVYLTGNHYFALQWCEMLDSGGYMDFRYAQLEMFYHMEACIIDNRSLGHLFLKSRRTGFTYIALAISINLATSKRNAKHGMTSKSGDDVQEAFDKLSYMFLRLPFFFRPVVKGKEDSPSELFFGKPSENTKEAKKARKTGIKDYLNTSLDHRPTKNDSYDSVKLDNYIGDECYKWVRPHDYIVHLGMITPTLMPAGKVVGKAFLGSTMGSLEKGGEQGVEMIRGSYVADRDSITKKTSTGLYFHFLPAQENMEEFTDIYGRCWTETPPKPTKNILGGLIKLGSNEYLIAVEEQKRKQSDKAYNEQLRTYPRTIEHALRDESEDCIYNMAKLYENIEYNTTLPEDSKYMIGNFEWEGGVKDSKVFFSRNPKGRFKISWLPSKIDGTEALANNIRKSGDRFYPNNSNVIRFGCDPFSLKSTHGEGSKGGIHGKTLMFPEGGAPSNKFCVEYLARPADEYIFFEDVIKCVIYYGAPILVESNRIDLLRHMRNRGYRPFAMNRLDRPLSKLNPNEKEYGGQPMSGKDMLDSHMNSIGAWVENYVGIYTDENRKIRPVGEMGDMVFNDTLRDWLTFNPDKRTKYDATISSGLAIMACQTEKYKGVKKKNKDRNVSTILKRYSNAGSVSTDR
jgi:hypothetical protein